MSNRKTVLLTAILLAVIISLYNPILRRIILFILPLGGGPDDVLFLLACVGLGIVWFIRFWTKLGEKIR